MLMEKCAVVKHLVTASIARQLHEAILRLQPTSFQAYLHFAKFWKRTSRQFRLSEWVENRRRTSRRSLCKCGAVGIDSLSVKTFVSGAVFKGRYTIFIDVMIFPA